MRKRQKLIAQCDAWWQSHCHNWNLHGSHVIDAKLCGVTLRIRVKGMHGRHSIHHFRQAIPLIESAAEGQADIGMVRVEPVKGDPSQVDIFLKQENPLREPVEYDLEHRPAVGARPGAVRQGWKPARGRWSACAGTGSPSARPGAGKSNDLLVGVANLSGCPDGRFVLIDLKGGRSARPVLKSGAAEYVITEVDEARMYLRMTVAEIHARSMYAYDGNEQLIATEDIPGIWTMIDETSRADIHRGTATARPADCWPPTPARATAWSCTTGSTPSTGRWRNRSAPSRSAGTCPGAPATGSPRPGTAPTSSPSTTSSTPPSLEEKGTCYDKDGQDVTPEQIRAPHMPHQLLTRIADAERGADRRPPAAAAVLRRPGRLPGR